MQRIGAFVHSDEIERYHYPDECPFKTTRAAKTKSILCSIGRYQDNSSREVAPRPATEKELRLFHTPEYIDALRRISRGDFRADDFFLGIGTEETPVFRDIYPYAELATGGTVIGAEMILYGDVDFVFNPSGGYHHAMAGSAGGFCYVNDVVIGCKVLVAHKKKVFCLDLDARHGNGTQAAFYKDPSVFTVSFHESGKTLYPFSGFEDEIGDGAGFGYNVNVPLPAGTDDDIFLSAYQAIVPPLIQAYKPDAIVLQIGMNILSGDPLAHLAMTNNAIADLLPALRESGIPLLVVGGGGCNPEQTARGWALAWTVLCGREPGNDRSKGMGGMVPGNSESTAGLRDRHVHSPGDEKERIQTDVARTIDIIKKTVFPIHAIK